MKARLVPLYFRSADDPDFAAQTQQLRELLGDHAELLEPHPLGDEHAGHIVVRHDEQLRGVTERPVVGQRLGLDVTVHADQWQRPGVVEEAACDQTCSRVGRQCAVLVQG